eukprot:2755325-Pleurochrysis_carterae.AAC.1
MAKIIKSGPLLREASSTGTWKQWHFVLKHTANGQPATLAWYRDEHANTKYSGRIVFAGELRMHVRCLTAGSVCARPSACEVALLVGTIPFILCFLVATRKALLDIA